VLGNWIIQRMGDPCNRAQVIRPFSREIVHGGNMPAKKKAAKKKKKH
jgi:hypothetical protein